ncbi:MAG: D-alanyl-D-alanine carboxypeptidase/D-alanyl-D-alanine-endopeptidase [Chitinispirillaceae bacterium]
MNSKPLYSNQSIKYHNFILLLFLSLHLCALPAFTKTKKHIEQNILKYVSNGSVVLNDPNSQTLISHRTGDLFIPASIIKILTSAIATDLLGSGYRFKTDFSLSDSNEIVIRGWGDPYLISEEIELIAEEMKKRGGRDIKRISIDNSNFTDITIPGVSSTSNPYDALNGALVTNFNTINIRKCDKGEIHSAEEVTPLTPLAVLKGKWISRGTRERINLSANRKDCLNYAGELFIAILKKHGIRITSSEIGSCKTDSTWKPLYTHFNSRNLTEINRGLQKYSNNFIANQLFLTVGAEKKGYPATLEKGKAVFENYIRTHLKIPSDQLVMHEGSGISRKNRVTADVMIGILEKRKDLLSDILPRKQGVLVKSGTLNGVSNYAGYIPTSNGLHPFVIMLNQKSNYRDRILHLLKEYCED